LLNPEMQSYIFSLPIAPLLAGAHPEDVESANAIDVDNLPDMVVAGSNLIQFSDDTNPAIKTGVALALLAAQRVASEDAAATATPDQWIQRHDTVLTNLDWRGTDPKAVSFEFKRIDEAINQAIVPFLTDAFSGTGSSGQLILDALNELNDANKNSHWFALFDKSSQRFQVTEYQFSAVGMTGDQVNLRLASARFEASLGRTQVLFIKVNKQHASFQGAMQDFSAHATDVTDIKDALKVKLAGFAKSFIRDLTA
jgi:hypothetical protein